MSARTYRELDAWKLAAQLRREVGALLANPVVPADRRFCDQIRDATRSVARNIAEGFGRYQPGDFARFLTIARGSLDETDNHLRDGVECGYFEPADAAALIHLAARCRSAINSLQSYLRSPSASAHARHRPR